MLHPRILHAGWTSHLVQADPNLTYQQKIKDMDE